MRQVATDYPNAERLLRWFTLTMQAGIVAVPAGVLVLIFASGIVRIGLGIYLTVGGLCLIAVGGGLRRHGRQTLARMRAED
jgi:hypothetical protein